MTLYFRTDDREAGFIETEGELNMSNSNATAFLRFCGFNPDPEDGSIPAQPVADFLQQMRDTLLLIETSQAANVNFDGGKESRTYEGRGATIIDCGRPAGYMEARVRFAIQLTEEAISKGATFCYFV